MYTHQQIYISKKMRDFIPHFSYEQNILLFFLKKVKKNFVVSKTCCNFAHGSIRKRTANKKKSINK